MTGVKRLKADVERIAKEANRRKLDPTLIGVVRRRIDEARRRAQLQRESIHRVIEDLDCDLDTLHEIEGLLIDIELEVDEQAEAGA